MNDDLMFDYLLEMGAMRPEQEDMRRRQAMVDTLRKSAMTPMEGQMIGKHYVSPGLGGALSQLGQAYFSTKGQQGVDAGMQKMNETQRRMLEDLRRRRQGGAPQTTLMLNNDRPAMYGTDIPAPGGSY
jgi:hypothetical protein